MYEALRAEANRLRDNVVRFTQELIRIPSRSLHEKQLAVRIQGEMQRLDFDLSFTDDVGNVIGVIAASDPSYTLLLNSHMDTVQSGSFESWSSLPLSGEVRGDRIVGLGASDCKGGIASQIYAAHVLGQSTLERRVNVVVATTVAEENGCSLGTRHLLGTTLPRLGVEPKFCILGEPTDLNVCFGHDGWACFDLDVFATNPEASSCAAKIIHQALRLHCNTDGRDRLSAVMVTEEPVVTSANDRRSVRIRVLRRLFSGDTAEEIIEWLSRLVTKELNGIDRVSIDVRLHEEDQKLYTGLRKSVPAISQPWTTNLMHPLVDRARESLLSAGFSWNPRLWALDRLGMGTAGSVLSAEFGLPTIGFGPGEEAQAHAPDESVSATNLVEAVYGCAVLIHGFNTASGLLFQQNSTGDSEATHG